MGEDSAPTGHTEAQAMLETFGSVGAVRFNDVDDARREKEMV